MKRQRQVRTLPLLLVGFNAASVEGDFPFYFIRKVKNIGTYFTVPVHICVLLGQVMLQNRRNFKITNNIVMIAIMCYFWLQLY